MVKGMERIRPYLLEPGDSLLVASDVEGALLRYGEVARLSGIPIDRIVLSFMSSLPMPRYEKLADGELRWAGARAEELWAPIFWIPDEISQRMPVADAEAADGLRGESDDEWSARIALHMVLSGLYRPETGDFVDVPAALGVDLLNEDVATRVQDWLDGAADAELDGLDPSPLWQLPGDDDAASVYFTLKESYSDLFSLSRYIGFDTALRMIDEISSRSDEIEDDTAKEAAAYAVTVGRLVAIGVEDADLDDVIADAEANVVAAQTKDEILGFALTEFVAALVEARDEHKGRADRAVRSGTAAIDAASTQAERPSAMQVASESTQP